MKTNVLLLSWAALWTGTAIARNAQADQLVQALHGHSSTRFRALQERNSLLDVRASEHEASSSKPRFLNKATSKFAVDGKKVPEVDFDVGESYAGQLPISTRANERDNLFFWFFPTVNEEAQRKKEIVIWLNGGPGCSSLLGFLQENGPFLWQPGTPKPTRNPFGWQLLTNVVWVEQPVTVGFSTGNATITNEDELAEQFLGFWKNFIETFSMQGWKVYVAAESYGGTYGPFIASHMLSAKDTQHHNLKGLLIYDGLIADGTVQSNVPVASFMEQYYDLIPLDDSARQRIQNISDTCGYTDYHKKYLTYPPPGPAPKTAPGVKTFPNGTQTYEGECGDIFEILATEATIKNPCFNVYNIQDRCPKVQDPLSGKPYFDRLDVKKAIHAPLSVAWSQCVDGVFNTTDGDESSPPDRYELPRVIDKTQNVILAHGSKDYVLPLNGVLLGLQNMTWGGKLGFQTAPSDPFYVPLYGFDPDSQKTDFYGANLPQGAGVLGTTHHERGLTLVVTELAGHEGPEYSGAGAFRHLEKLLGRVHSLSDTTPFTLPQLRNVTQQKTKLGKGTVKIPCFKRGC